MALEGMPDDWALALRAESGRPGLLLSADNAIPCAAPTLDCEAYGVYPGRDNSSATCIRT